MGVAQVRFYPPRAPRNPSGHWSSNRSRIAQAHFRAALVKRAGNRCEWVDSNGRCVKALGLQAHHTQPGNDDPTTGLLLCTIHHKALDPHAR
jgi:predicted restriction endonuclease